MAIDMEYLGSLYSGIDKLPLALDSLQKSKTLYEKLGQLPKIEICENLMKEIKEKMQHT